MKLIQLLDPTLRSTLNKMSQLSVPVKVALKVRQIIKKVNENITQYEEMRTELCLKYSTKKEDGTPEIDSKNNYVFSKENQEEFSKKILELANVDVELPTIDLNDLGDKLELSADELSFVETLLT